MASTRRGRKSKQTPQRRNGSRTTKQLRAPTSADDLFQRTEVFQDTWERVLELVASMRQRGASFPQALAESGLMRETALRLAGPALRRLPNGRYVTRSRDSLLRVLVVPTPQGLTEVPLRSSTAASTIGEYLNALHVYLAKGDATALAEFQGLRVADADGVSIALVTDVARLDELASAGVLSFESIYARGGR